MLLDVLGLKIGFAMFAITWSLVNIDSQLHMQTDLGMSGTVYGTGAGLFFMSYFLLEVPADMMLRRLGAHRFRDAFRSGKVWLLCLALLERIP